MESPQRGKSMIGSRFYYSGLIHTSNLTLLGRCSGVVGHGDNKKLQEELQERYSVTYKQPVRVFIERFGRV